jgi:hypothetical protein
MLGAIDIPDAFLEPESESLAPSAAGLRAIVPVPPEADWEKLERESSRHRVLLIRTSAVIAVSTVISVGGALLLHALFAGLVVVGVYFPWAVPSARGGTLLAGAPDMGGSPGGFTVLGDGPDDNAPPSDLPPSPGSQTLRLIAAIPAAPPLPDVTSAQLAAQITTPEAPLPPTPGLGEVHIAPPLRALPANGDLTVAPPGIAGAPSAQPSPTRGTGTGNGGGDEDRIYGISKGDGTGGKGAGGSGSGSGGGRGSGIDRGLSAADRQAMPLNQTSAGANFTLPLKYQLHPPERPVQFILTIAADGSITSVKIDKSCGITEIDEMLRDYVLATFRFSPAFSSGKAISSEFPLEFSFQPF